MEKSQNTTEFRFDESEWKVFPQSVLNRTGVANGLTCEKFKKQKKKSMRLEIFTLCQVKFLASTILATGPL